ncbi:hypothetical protein ACXU4B_09650 [Dyella soli]|uniref:Uncharacterized protein n=1 Tax=Dyella soli TaxID=522319 RepID=A0A4R0YQF2_9GAMM|nr:hypothetical protein [Dyella soli]TCI11199.1 hypothetical protein EZM97_20540 [Dyella soli]
MTKRLLCLIIGLALSRLCPAADFNPFEGPEPLLVVMEFDPWSMVLGADSPRLAIYENGDAIFIGKDGGDRAYRFKRLSTKELEALRQQAGKVFRGTELKHHYDLRGVTDQPVAEFYFHDARGFVATEVVGLECEPSKPFPWYRVVAPPPQALLDLNASLCSLDFPGSEKWLPPYAEVMMWDYHYAPGTSVPWPTTWPGLGSSRTLRRGEDYSIFMDGAMLPQLKAFVHGIPEKSAVSIDGKKKSVSVRIPFPSEPVWRRALESIR